MGQYRRFYLVVLISVVCLFAKGAQGEEETRKAPEIAGSVWFNAGAYKKLNMKALQDKVVLIFFWISNDSNCINFVPILNSWYLEYKEKGLEIIGFHSSGFMQGVSESELFQRIEALGIKFPVALGDDLSLRQNYGQGGWPSFVLIDRKGFIRAEYSCVVNYKELRIMLEALLEEGESKSSGQGENEL